MNSSNITKALAYLFVMFLLLAVGGFYYHKTAEKVTPTPTPVDNNPTPVDENPVPTADNDFIVQAQTIFQGAQQQWMNDSVNTTEPITYCDVEGCAAGVNGIPEIYKYYVGFNQSGNIIKFYVTNGEYQYVYVGDGLFIENITNPSRISDIDPSEVITITANM